MTSRNVVDYLTRTGTYALAPVVDTTLHNRINTTLAEVEAFLAEQMSMTDTQQTKENDSNSYIAI